MTKGDTNTISPTATNPREKKVGGARLSSRILLPTTTSGKRQHPIGVIRRRRVAPFPVGEELPLSSVEPESSTSRELPSEAHLREGSKEEKLVRRREF